VLDGTDADVLAGSGTPSIVIPDGIPDVE